tara:strand:- start:5831 stop:6751 length:921 start_codon:yes stop_codon:yes gene_type:complete
MKEEQVLISIIVPSYNEEKDIERTLEAACSSDWDNKEVICIDDSTDNTKKIIKKIQLKYNFVKLYSQIKDLGLNGAYNLGMQKSSGEIIILLTADNIMPKNFIKEIFIPISKGFDFVVPISLALELEENIYARYHQSYQDYRYRHKNFSPLWSEGFTISKKIISDSVYFHVTDIPINGGSDITFAKYLSKKYKKYYSDKIIMTHLFPDNFKEFFHQQLNRGIGFSHTNYFLRKQTRIFIFLKLLIKIFKRLLYDLFKNPFASYFNSKYNIKNLFLFIWVELITITAMSAGEIKGFIDTFSFSGKNG